jgi:hypothetical protein
MKQNKRFLVLALSALALFIVICSTNVFAADEVTVTGTVYPTALDENDNVIAAVIDTSMGEGYVIVANAAGKKLFELEYKAVKASGVIGQDSEGNKTLTVTSFEVIPESE